MLFLPLFLLLRPVHSFYIFCVQNRNGTIVPPQVKQIYKIEELSENFHGLKIERKTELFNLFYAYSNTPT
jgi:hypothetical protein